MNFIVMESRFWNKVNIKSDTECWEWTGCIQNNGYGKFGYTISKYNVKHTGAHRIAYELHHKRPIQEGMYILHSCDNPKCCNPYHLSEGTPKDNTLDMIAKRRQGGNKKVTEEIVLKIREDRQIGFKIYELVHIYGLSRTQIKNIINKKSWSNV